MGRRMIGRGHVSILVCFTVIRLFLMSSSSVSHFHPCLTAVLSTVKPQWLEHLWDHRNLFETWVVRATEG